MNDETKVSQLRNVLGRLVKMAEDEIVPAALACCNHQTLAEWWQAVREGRELLDATREEARAEWQESA